MILVAIIHVLFNSLFSRLNSMKYSNIPGYDDMEEHRTLTSEGGSGTEAFV